VKEIEINNILVKYMKNKPGNTENPIPLLECYQVNDINDPKFKQEFDLSKDINFINNNLFRDESDKIWPENIDTLNKRALQLQENYRKEIDNHIKKDQQKNDKICYLVVSHGSLVDSLGSVYDSMKWNGFYN
jgi:hypothetical protein